MKSAVLTIGDELLGGFTLDSNGAWIGRKLMDIGIRTIWKSLTLMNIHIVHFTRFL